MRHIVIFDVGCVLTNYHLNDYFLNLGYPEDIAERLKKATQLSKDWNEYDCGVLTDEEIRNRFKKNAPDFSEEIDRSLTHEYGLVSKEETSVPWVKSLKEKGYKTYILSNLSDTTYHDCHDTLDFEKYMDGCFWSWQHHVIKPDDACFLTMLYEFHIDPNDAVFIDDTKENLIAAEKFGLKTVLYINQLQAERDFLEALQ
jgi:FMN phosphatase YigB (HAD superfamily)